MKRFLTSCALIFGGAFPAAAQIARTDSAMLTAGSVVVYAAAPRTPLSYQNITEADFAKRNVGQEPSFLLSQLSPSVTAYSDGGFTQGYSYYRFRGIDQTRINMTLDGAPMNEPEDQGAYFSNYPDLFNSVRLVQIQRGVSSTQNGTVGYAGSIALFSPDLRDSAYGTVGAGYGSYNSYRVFAEYNSGIEKGKGLYARISDIHSDGYRYRSGNDGQSAMISTGYFGKRNDITLLLLAGLQRNELAWLGVSDSLIQRDPRTNANGDEKDRFLQGLVQLRHVYRLRPKSRITTGLYYTILDGAYDFDVDNFTGIPAAGEIVSYAFRSHFTGLYSNYSYSSNGFTWTSGFNGSLYQRRHTGSERSAGRLYQNTGYKAEISFYSRAEYTVRRLRIFGDMQYRTVGFDYHGDARLERIVWRMFNPKGGVSYALSEKLLAYYTIGRCSREPTRNDIAMGLDNLAADSLGRAITGTTNEEQVTDGEIGLRYRNDRLTADVNAYYMRFRNEIVLNRKLGPNGLALTDQVDASYRSGLELTVAYKVADWLMLRTASSYNHSRIRQDTVRFTPIITPRLILNAEAELSRNAFSLIISSRYQSASFIDFANSADLPAYLLFNASLHYHLKRLDAAIFVNNITNQQYFNNGYVDYDGSRKFFVQAPANFYLSLSYRFL